MQRKYNHFPGSVRTLNFKVTDSRAAQEHLKYFFPLLFPSMILRATLAVTDVYDLDIGI